MELDQKSIAIFLSLQGKSATLIHMEMKNTLGAKCVSYQSITKYLRDYNIGLPSPEKKKSEKFLRPDGVSAFILRVLGEYPFASLRQIEEMTGIPKSTVEFHLTQKLKFKNVLLKWIPHRLNEGQKEERVSISKELLKILRSAKHRGWKYFVTGDESWFYFSYDHDRMWIQPGEKPETREKKMIGSQKAMLSVFWNPNGIQVINWLPEGSTFNAQYYIDEILCPLSEMDGGFPDNEGRRLTVHADNAKPHTARKATRFFELSGLKKAPHPPYSPDIAPSDFFLFGYVKEKLKGSSFETRYELFAEVQKILNEIPKETLENVFEEWDDRLRMVINTNGDYI